MFIEVKQDGFNISNNDFDIRWVRVPCPWNGRYESHAAVLYERSSWASYKLSNLTQSVPITVNLWVAYTNIVIFV